MTLLQFVGYLYSQDKPDFSQNEFLTFNCTQIHVKQKQNFVDLALLCNFEFNDRLQRKNSPTYWKCIASIFHDDEIELTKGGYRFVVVVMWLTKSAGYNLFQKSLSYFSGVQ